MLPAVETGLLALPVLAQLGQSLAGQALVLPGQIFFQCGVGGGFGRFGAGDYVGLCSALAGGFGDVLFEFLLCLKLGG